MKKIVFALMLCLCVGNLFAQDANSDKLRDEGDAALKAKNYAVAVTKYAEFLKLTNYEDADRVFNCAFAAFNAKKFDEAVKYYDMSIKKNKNIDDAYVGKAMALRNQGKGAEFMATIEAGLKAVPKDANMEKLLYGFCMKAGQEAQKKGDLAKAEEMFKEVLAVSNQGYKGNALYSLGILFYNNGAKILQAATPIATTDADKYAAEKAKATADFKKAKDYLDQAVATNATNATFKKALAAVVDVLK